MRKGAICFYLRTLIAAAIIAFVTAHASAKTAVILSTDIGNEIDDQWAIAYMMLNPDFEVLGVISAHAPSIPAPASRNGLLLLRSEIESHLNMNIHPPLIAGGDEPLADRNTPQITAAVRFIIEQSKRFSIKDRLTVIGIGAATDIASAILVDPSIADRIRVVAMAFKNQDEAKEYNVLNDVAAWQVILNSHVSLIIGPGDVCRHDLAMHYDQAKMMLSEDGPIGSWLWGEYDKWYYRQVKPLRKNDFTKPWFIWDIITLAYLEGMTKSEVKPRPMLNDDVTFSRPADHGTVVWITAVDSTPLWNDFQNRLRLYLSTHAVK